MAERTTTPKLYSYVLSHDAGAAPNPFWGHCTLAICKPKIRRRAKVGNWIVGIGPAGKPTHGKLIYAMEVNETLPFKKYFRDRRFAEKKPQPDSDDWTPRSGDNIYRPLIGGRFKQLKGPHKPRNKAKDLRGENVLISKRFYYFGRKAVRIPKEFKRIAKGGRPDRCKFSPDLVARFVKWVKGHRIGIHGDPAKILPRKGGSCESK